MFHLSTNQKSAAYVLALLAGLLALYATGFKNQLVFDDARLTDGTIFSQYGSLLELRVRTLSYGSFVWIQTILGESWPIQRLFNLALHCATAIALGALVHELLKSTTWSEHWHQSADRDGAIKGASQMAAAIWAFHPVAVYGVAYLIQRSIVMATLFVVLACLCLVWGMKQRRWVWYLAAVVFYVLALASKEYAISALLCVPPLYIFVRRPGFKMALTISLGAVGLMGLSAALLVQVYGSIIGVVFDETSRAFAVQLEQIQPGIGKDLYALSILNQASLFWRYGMTWLMPLPGFMAVDIRPQFPLGFVSLELVGAVAYVLAMLGSAWLVLRRSDAWALAALALLLPGLMFVTEFTTVWIQDPFVLYRSYLWSITLPLLLAIPLAYAQGKTQLIATVLLCLVLALLSWGRIDSFYNARSVWADAAAKIDTKAPAQAVGRWRPFLNYGAEALERADYVEATRLFSTAVNLGEPLGSARMNLGVALQQQKQHNAALEQLAQAERQGFTEAALYYHRGESYFAIRNFEEAQRSFTQALGQPQAPEVAFFTRVRRAEAAVVQKDFATAIADYKVIVAAQPDAQRYLIGLVMAHIGQKDYASALDLLNPALAKRPTSGAHYARALTYFNMGNRAASVLDLNIALSAEPNNPAYRQLERQLAGAAPKAKP
jgi:tetratricopeptide (TPR) repeat protein